MCRPVASPTCAAGNGRVGSWDDTPNGKGNHHRTQGKAKVGMVNESEPSIEASSNQATEMMDETVVLGHKR